MMKKRILPLSMAILMALATACGAKAGDKQTTTDDIVLSPLEEKKLSPMEEAQAPMAEPDSVGNMMVYPSGYDETACLYGTNTITFYFENEGVVGGSGYIYTYESPSGAAFSSVSTSSSNVTVSPMDDAGKLYTGWEKGTKIDVCFSDVFEKDKNYYVLLDPGAFRLNDHLSKSITNASLITFRVKEYGFEPFATELYNGQQFSCDVRLGGEATAAVCDLVALSKDGIITENGSSPVSSEGTDGAGENAPSSSLSISERFSSDGTFAPALTGYEDCAAAFRVTYYNEKGASIDSSTFIVTMGDPVQDDLALLRGFVYGTQNEGMENLVGTDDAKYTQITSDDLKELSQDNSTPETDGTEVAGNGEDSAEIPASDVTSADVQAAGNPDGESDLNF